MKKGWKIAVFLTLCLLVFGLGGGARNALAATEAASGEISNIAWVLDSDGKLTFSLVDPGESGVMPQVQSYQQWRQYSGDIRSVVIESGVTSISIAAFSGCVNLTGIDIPASVTEIGSEAFSGCTSLEEVTLTDNVTAVGSYMTFYRGIKVHVPTARGAAAKAVSAAGANCYLAGDTSFALQCSGEGVVTLKAYTGEETTVEIPGHVDRIADKAFQNNTAITAVTIPSSVTVMGQYAFEGCSALETVAIEGSGLTNIGYYAFRSCSALSSINIPASVTAIEAGAFYSCSALPSLTLTDNVATAGSYAFQGANSLKIYVPTLRGAAAKAVSGSGANYYLTSDTGNVYTLQCSGEGLVTLKGYAGEDAALTLDWADAIGYGVFQGNDTLTALTLTGVTSIDRYAFYECYSLTTLTFTDDSLTSVGSSAFSRTSSDLRIYVQSANGSAARAVSSQADHYYLSGSEDFGLSCSSDGAVTLKRYEGSDTALTLPGHINILAERLFEGNTALESVAMPGVTTIRNYAFKGCTALTDVTLPATLNSIGWEAFCGCTGLTEVAIPAAAASIGGSAFNGCANLTTVTIAGGSALTEIGERAFQNCVKLTGIEIPATVTSIGGYYGYTFDGCTALETVTFGADSQLSAINSYTFRNCSSLTAISIPASVTSIGYDAFDGCADLASVTFGAGSQLTSLGNGAFRGCASLTGIVLPDSLTTIDSNAFYGCAGLTEIVIPTAVSRMNENAFRDCTALTAVSFANGSALTAIGTNAFQGCTGLETVTFGNNSALTTINENAFYGCASLSDITLPATLKTIGRYAFTECASLTDANIIPDGVETIGNNAFWKCTGFTSVNIPASVTTLSNSAFNYCSNLATVTFAEGSELDKIDQYVFCYCSSLSSINIPDTVTSIGNNAFQYCASMTAIDIPDAVTSIGGYAFSESGLTSVTVPDNVSEIGNYAFGFCPDLTTVSLPENGGLTEISWGAFNTCPNLTSINIPSTVTYLGTYAFSGCTSLEDLYLPASVTSISGSFHGAGNIRVHVPTWDGDTAKAVSNTRETNFYVGDDTAWALRHSGEDVHLYKYTGTAVEDTLPEYVTGIGSEAAFRDSTLKKLTVTDSLSSVAAYLSFGSGEDELRIYVPTPDGGAAKAISNIYTMTSGASTVYFVTGYDDLALQCRGDDPVTLRKYVGASENVVLPEFVKTIYQSAFSGNTAVKHVTMTNVTSMQRWAFWQCTALETVTLNEGLTEIDVQTFTGCTSLASVNIPESVTNIYDSAFEGLQDLRLSAWCGSYGAEWAAGHGFGADQGDEPASGKQLRVLHDWGEIAYTWNEDHTEATAARVCQRDEEHVETETVAVTAEITLAATCEAMGQTTYTSAAFVNPAFEAQEITLTDVPALGHDWAEPTYAWSQDNTEVTATRICRNDETHPQTETVTVTAEITLAATCEAMGQTTYTTAAFQNPAFSVQTQTLTDIPALGHDWAEPVYTWSQDNTEVTASRVCKNDDHHTQTETVAVTAEITLAAACEAMGKTTYTTAAFQNPAFSVQTQTLTDIPALGHDWNAVIYDWNEDHTELTASRICKNDDNHMQTETVTVTAEVIVAPTCTELGQSVYTSGSFQNPAFEAQTLALDDVPALGHDWEEATYAWSEDNTEVTATHVCRRDGSHVESETVAVVADIATDPTCTEPGLITYTTEDFTKAGFTVQTQTLPGIPATGHDWNPAAYIWNEDHTQVTAIRVCKHDNSHEETETVTATAKVVRAAGCEEMGRTAYTSQAFANPAFSIQSVVVSDIPAAGHDWGEPTYTWNEDYTQVTATRICRHDAGHVETETAAASGEITLPAACEEMGETTYTSEAFTNPAFAVQSVTLTDVPALGHEWSGITYFWHEDYAKLTARLTCAHDASHTVTETVEASVTAVQPATCAARGKTTYTSAAFENPAFTVHSITVANLPRAEHTWVRADSTAAADGKDGLRGGIVCSVCQQERQPGRTVSSGKVLYIPAVLRAIDAEAFAGIAAEQVTIPEGVTAIGSKAFAGCRNLLLAVIPASVTAIADDAFLGCGVAVICPADSYAASWCDDHQIPHNP